MCRVSPRQYRDVRLFQGGGTVDFSRRIALLFVTLGSLLPRLVAQGADSAMFHRGQWGADSIIGNGFFGAGALRFTSPDHAWLVDVGANYQNTSGTTNGVKNSGTRRRLPSRPGRAPITR